MVDPRVPLQPRRRMSSRGFWKGVWAVIGLGAVLSIILPLVLSPGVVPQAKAKQTLDGAAPGHAPSPSPTPTYYPPVWLSAQNAHIDASVIQVGEDANGAMQAPEGPNNDPIRSEEHTSELQSHSF